MLLLCVHSTACILKVLFTLIERDIKLAIITAGRQTAQSHSARSYGYTQPPRTVPCVFT